MSDIRYSYIGVDALTVTSSVDNERERMASKVKIAELGEFFKEEFYPRELRKFRRVPYAVSAWQCESLVYSNYGSYAKLELKGTNCTEAMAHMVAVDMVDQVKYTRVDLCVDYPLRYKTRNYLVNMRKQLHPDERKKTRLIQGEGDTLYFGSRESPNYGRIYDKSDDYGANLGSIFRFELEAKRVQAKRLSLGLADKGGDWTAFIVGAIGTAFHKWGVKIPSSFVPPEMPELTIALTSDEKRVLWLKRQVLPSIVGLVERGKGEQVVKALQLTTLFDLCEGDM